VTIRHVAIIELTPDCSESDRDALVAQIHDLGSSVPNVTAMSVGVARDESGLMLNRICLVSDHPSRADLDSYLAHPNHQAVVAVVGRLRESVSGADFEL
jgi:hypothetical protein